MICSQMKINLQAMKTPLSVAVCSITSKSYVAMYIGDKILLLKIFGDSQDSVLTMMSGLFLLIKLRKFGFLAYTLYIYVL